MKVPAFAAAVAGLVALCVPTGLDSCAIGPPEPVFVAVTRPADLTEFLRGRLGVLQKSYGQRYLIAAFRVLGGTALTTAEQTSLFRPVANSLSDWEATGKWLGIRRTLKGVDQNLTIARYKRAPPNYGYYQFRNCQDAAFETAGATLVELRKQWPGDDPRLADWVRAQDQVFANCSGEAAAPIIPAEPAPDAGALATAHRRYQIAAAHFYSGGHRKASEAFRRIAADPASPWREFGPYLSARALLRAGMLDEDAAAFQEGKAELLAILKDPARSKWHQPSLDLLHLWQIRVEPEVRLAQLGAELMTPSDDDRRQAVIDFLHLMTPRGSREAATGELAAWLVAMSPKPPTGTDAIALGYWRKTGNSAWLIASLANAPDEELPPLLEAARLIRPGTPAYESVSYYAITREIARGRRTAARLWADRALRQNLPRSARNLILQERMKIAVDWSEFLRFAVRRAETAVVLYDGAEAAAEQSLLTAPVYDQDAITAFNNALPLSLWMDASRNALAPARMQLQIAEAGWARAMALGKPDEARVFMRRVIEMAPEAELAAAFVQAANPEEAHHAAVYLVLRTPSLWPKLPPPQRGAPNLVEPRYNATDAYGYSTGCWNAGLEQKSVRPLDFLTAEQRATASAEIKQLQLAKPWNAEFLLGATLDWARAKPDDPRVPEALHRAVKAARYRCDSNRKLAQQAFSLLHRRYPKSPWTAQTKYWY